MQPEQGWFALMQQQLEKERPDLTLHNFSVSGETSGGAKLRLERLLKKYQPDMLWIELGGNDGLRGYPLKKIRHNLQQMILLATQYDSQVLLTEIEIPPNYGKRYTSRFKALFHELAEQPQVTLMPFFVRDIALTQGLMQSDGIHPTREAQPIIAEKVKGTILGFDWKE